MDVCRYPDNDKDGGRVADKKTPTSALKEKDIKITCTSVNSTSESLPHCTEPPRLRERGRTWGNDSVQEKSGNFSRWDWHSKARWKVRWTWFLHDACLSVWHATKWTATKIKKAPLWKHVRWSKKQFFAFCLVAVWILLPILLMFYLGPSTRIFANKTLSCGNGVYGDPQNATVRGIENLFALDATFGRFSFSQVKTIDILWDLLVGRGAQALAWWASYTVFCDALLRVIERHPASFTIFQRMALEGPGLHSLWTLTKELWRAKSARTRALFLYMFWSTAYVLLVPIVLGAMTGYDSTSIAWIDLQGGNNIFPAAGLKETWVIKGTKNETWEEPACAALGLQRDYNSQKWQRRESCDCQFPNGTMVAPAQRNAFWFSSNYYPYEALYGTCSYAYPNNTQTWTYTYNYLSSSSSTSQNNIYPCNASISVPVNGKTYDADFLDTDYGYCYNSIGYNYTYLAGKSRCLPDTANPSYQWGFATLMTGVFILCTTTWVVSMYILWQDAQWNCKLVAEGYRLTPLRAAFAMAVAARRRTGLSGRELVRAKTGRLKKELYGAKGMRGTEIDGALFREDVEGGEEDGSPSPSRSAKRGEVSPMESPNLAFATPAKEKEKEKEKNYPPSPTEASDTEITSLVRSNTDLSVHVLSDAELRKRYLRGIEEARLSRKPLSRESTWVEESLWERRCGGDGEDENENENEDDDEDKNGNEDTT